MKNMKKMGGLLAAALVMAQAGSAVAGPILWTSGDTFVTTTAPFASSYASSVGSSASTYLARRQVIMAAAGDAGAFVAADGRMEVSGVLGDAMRIEQGILNEQNGGDVEASDVQLAGRVVEHAERLKQGME